jgi:radical SAM protein with 4Fe4S-binding SPASM domain
LKIKDYLRMDAEKKAKLEAITTFPQYPDSEFPGKNIHELIQKETLSPWEKARIGTILPEAQKILKGDMPYPVFARVHLSYTCQHNCPGCLYGSNRKKDNVLMDSNSFSQLLDSLHSLKVEFVDLGGGGEPTLHPEFSKFARMCIKEKFKLSLSSNGTWSDLKIIDLLTEGFSLLRVNLDANSDEVYNRIHRLFVPGEFQKMLGNLEKIVSQRERVKSHLILGAKVSLGQTNMNFMEEMINLAKDMGMDYIQFQIKNKTYDSLLPEQKREVKKLMKELKNRYQPFSVYGEFESKKFHGGCWLSSFHLIIDPKGDVFPCPHFPHHPAAISFGNIFTQPVDELWFGSKHRQVVDRLREDDCPIQDCRWHFYNEFVRQRIKKDQKEQVF